MSGNYPDGFNQRMHDEEFDRLGPDPDDDEEHEAESGNQWVQAIEYAELKISKHQKGIRGLRRAIKVFERNYQQDEPWPGDGALNHPPAQPEEKES